jgi:hypothetical protein
VANGHIVVAEGADFAVIFGYDTKHVGARTEVFHHHDTHVVAAVMD